MIRACEINAICTRLAVLEREAKTMKKRVVDLEDVAHTDTPEAYERLQAQDRELTTRIATLEEAHPACPKCGERRRVRIFDDDGVMHCDACGAVTLLGESTHA